MIRLKKHSLGYNIRSSSVNHNTRVVEVHFQTTNQYVVNHSRSISSEKVSIGNRRPIRSDIVTTTSTENLRREMMIL